MRTATRHRDRAALLAIGAALLIAAGIGRIGLASAAAPLTPAEEPAASVLASPCAPLSVTIGRSFTVTAAVTGDAGDAASATVECRRLLGDGSWSAPIARRASLHATGPAQPYVSVSVSLPVAGTWVLRAVARTVTPSVSASSTAIVANTKSDAIVWNRDGVLTLPEQMVWRNDARQMIVATAGSLSSHGGTLAMYEYRDGDWVELLSTPCRFGRNGLRNGMKRHRDDGTTPTGIWSMPGYVFGTRKQCLSGVTMAYRHITSHTWWSAQKGRSYNRWVQSSGYVDGERLAAAPTQYEFALHTGYNAKPNPERYGRGTGIFLHVQKGLTTAGCVSVPRPVMLEILRELNPRVRRVFEVGLTSGSGATSIYAY